MLDIVYSFIYLFIFIKQTFHCFPCVIFKGYRRFSHGGSWFGFNSHNAIYPDMNTGIYTATNGNGGNIHTVLHDYISDLVLGIEPFHNDTTICTFPGPWGDPSNFDDPEYIKHVKYENNVNMPERKRDDMRSKADPGLNWHEPFVGVYGHKLWGNMTITHDPQDDDVLQFTVGRHGEGQLTRRFDTTFNIVYGGMLSYSSTGAAVWFQDLQDGVYQELANQDFTWNRPPVFRRGVLWDGEPKPTRKQHV